MNSWNILKRFFKEWEIVRYSNGWNPLTSKPHRKDKGLEQQKEGSKQGRIPSSFYQKATSQPTTPKREDEQEKELEETIFPKLQNSKNTKKLHRQCLQHGQNVDWIPGQ
ncbi:hypothetical protein O181_048312 [Austropuccinia psidii MF-1]|uniref:Uncharacterized protein n=1 Tax=Austropuccinia psidii MF-1 TaxID=1389203 RepID=A0A9Q3DUW6_9BASI|nr:hypothetical protein [Austropuccinia psidii MF-1]